MQPEDAKKIVEKYENQQRGSIAGNVVGNKIKEVEPQGRNYFTIMESAGLFVKYLDQAFPEYPKPKQPEATISKAISRGQIQASEMPGLGARLVEPDSFKAWLENFSPRHQEVTDE